mgnify:CR=1 FL=1
MEDKDEPIVGKIKGYIFKRYRNVQAIIDYGGRAVELKTKESDFDIVVICDILRPKREGIKINAKKVVLNVISPGDFRKDAVGKYYYYFITKLINPFKYYFVKNGFDKEVETTLSKFMLNFAFIFFEKGIYSIHNFIRKFYQEYTNINPHYVYDLRKLLILEIRTKQFNFLTKIMKQSPSCVNDKLTIIPKHQFLFPQIKQRFFTNRILFGIALRPSGSNYPDGYFKKREKWIERNNRKINQIHRLLRTA